VDTTAEPRVIEKPDRWLAASPPSQLALLTSGIRRIALHPIKSVLAIPKLLPHVDELAGVAARVPGIELLAMAGSVLSRLARQGPGRHEIDLPKLIAPKTPFDGSISLIAGDRLGRPLLLIMGLGAPMIWWDDEFCQALTERGFFVIRFDNRDAGGRARWTGECPPLRRLCGQRRTR
jgi:hypothetical protein